MSKIMKMALSIAMSFTVIICSIPMQANAEEIDEQNSTLVQYNTNELQKKPTDLISLNSIVIGTPYSKADKYGKITFTFSNQYTLKITYKNKNIRKSVY